MRKSTVALLWVLALVAGGLTGGTFSAFSTTTGNPSNSFTAADSFTCTPPTVSPVWMSGMEHGVVSSAGAGLFNTVSGTPTADNTVARNGAYSLKIADTSNSVDGPYAVVTVSSTVVVTRFAIRFNTLPTVDAGLVVDFDVATGHSAHFSFKASTNKFYVGYWTGTDQNAATAISANTWYVIDMRLNVSANPHTLDWSVDGVAQTSASIAEAATTLTSVYWGEGFDTDVYTAYYDDMIISTTVGDYPIGDGKVLGLSPNAMGTNNDPSSRMQDDDSTAPDANSYQRVDDMPLTETSAYVKQTANDAAAYVEFEFANTIELCVNAVEAYLAFHTTSTSANAGKASIYDSSTERIVYNGAMNTTSLSYKSAFISPATGTWDQTKVNALKARVGYSSDSSPNPYWDALLLEYNVDTSVSAGCTPGTVNPIWMSGMEHGVFSSGAPSFGTYNGSGHSADAAVKRNGGYSLKINDSSGSTASYAEVVLSPQPNQIVARFAVLFPTLPGSTIASIFQIDFTTGHQQHYKIGYDAGTNKFTAGMYSGTLQQSSMTLSANTWYVIDVKHNASINHHLMDWQVNGVAQTQATDTYQNADTIEEIWFGAGSAADQVVVNYDDMMLSSTTSDYPIGDGKILGLSPNAMGTNNDPSSRMQDDDSTAPDANSYQRVDDMPLTETSAYVKQTANDAAAYLEFNFADTAETCINAVQAFLTYHTTSTSANAGKTSIYDSTTERIVYNGAMNTTSLTYKQAFISPATGTWDQTKVNGLTARVGYSSDSSPNPYWDGLLLEYNVDP